MSGPERGEDRALSRRILPFFEKFMPSSCQQPAVRDGCHRSASAILKDHIATVGALTSRFFGPNGFKVSFNGSVSFHRLGEKQEVDKAGERDVSRLVNNHDKLDCTEDVAHLHRLCEIARLEAEIRDLELKHRMKVDELSKMVNE
ncbi:unnamed protein product [Heligmosomoides polygyrus]|uniref:Protein Muted homolog n=1 Tax=Heligmosomoides polygyrus TaxID=6339 RepID=A0A183FE81_HELPZ|nr:unnamed protein product [Heligmosomoides polygyrus]